MLGSFPPQSKRWSIDFYYPNFINDMWRIMGLIFFNDKNRFVDVAAKKFRLDDIVDFCTGTGIAMYDTATAVRRLKDNASDKFLEVVTPTDIPALLRQIPAKPSAPPHQPPGNIPNSISKAVRCASTACHPPPEPIPSHSTRKPPPTAASSPPSTWYSHIR